MAMHVVLLASFPGPAHLFSAFFRAAESGARAWERGYCAFVFYVWGIFISLTYIVSSLVPRPPPQLLSLAVRKGLLRAFRTASDKSWGGGLGTRLHCIHDQVVQDSRSCFPCAASYIGEYMTSLPRLSVQVLSLHGEIFSPKPRQLIWDRMPEAR